MTLKSVIGQSFKQIFSQYGIDTVKDLTLELIKTDARKIGGKLESSLLYPNRVNKRLKLMFDTVGFYSSKTDGVHNFSKGLEEKLDVRIDNSSNKAKKKVFSAGKSVVSLFTKSEERDVESYVGRVLEARRIFDIYTAMIKTTQDELKNPSSSVQSYVQKKVHVSATKKVNSPSILEKALGRKETYDLTVQVDEKSSEVVASSKLSMKQSCGSLVYPRVELAALAEDIYLQVLGLNNKDSYARVEDVFLNLSGDNEFIIKRTVQKADKKIKLMYEGTGAVTTLSYVRNL